MRLDGHWPLHHELPDAVDCLNLPRLLQPFSPGAPDGRLQGRHELNSIGPSTQGRCAMAVVLRRKTSAGAMRRHL